MNEKINFKLEMQTDNGFFLYSGWDFEEKKRYWIKKGVKQSGHIGCNSLENEISSYRLISSVSSDFIVNAKTIEYEGQTCLLLEQAEGDSILYSWDSLSQFERQQCFDGIVAFLYSVNEIRGNRFGSIIDERTQFSTEEELLWKMYSIRKEDTRRYFEHFDSLMSTLSTMRAYASIPVYVHYDLWKGNIFWDKENKKVTIIDLERSIFADKCAEGASLLGMYEGGILERLLCNNRLEIILKMYIYRILFLLESIEDTQDIKRRISLIDEINRTYAVILSKLE